MVGDWVFYGGTPIKVENVYEDFINFQHDIPFVQEEFLIEQTEVEPIPLTPEILEKNGFTLKEEEKGMYGVTIAPYYTRDDVPFEVFCDGEPFAIWFKDPVNIKYVHELQRALRLCGINREIII